MSYVVPGPLNVTWGGISLGRIKNNAVLRARTGIVPITDDPHGESPATFLLAGKSCIVDFGLLEVTALKAAAPWAANVLLSIENAAIGTLASQIAKAFNMVERNGGVWAAAKAVPLDPAEIALSSTRELVLPVVFLILPDSNGDLFQTMPAYMTT